MAADSSLMSPDQGIATLLGEKGMTAKCTGNNQRKLKMESTLQSHASLLQADSAVAGVPALQRGSCVSLRIRQIMQLASQAPDMHKLTSHSPRSAQWLGDMIDRAIGLPGKDVSRVSSSILHLAISASHHSQILGLENWEHQTASGIRLGGSFTSA